MAVPVQPKLWQHPYVNVFRLCDVENYKDCSKEGDVQVAVDRTIGKRVLKIHGSVPASNYVHFPKRSQYLALTGRFLYVQARFLPSKYFVLHIDAVTDKQLPYRISVSNLYKADSSKKAEGNSIQLAYPFQVGRWTLIALDLTTILSQYAGAHFAHVKSIQVCATMSIRGLFTSDQKYSMANAPRDMHVPTSVEPMVNTVWLPEEPPDVIYGTRSKAKKIPPAGVPTVLDPKSGKKIDNTDLRQEVCPARDVVTSGADNQENRDSNMSTRALETTTTATTVKSSFDFGSQPQSQDRLTEAMQDISIRNQQNILKLERMIGFNTNHGFGVLWAPNSREVVFSTGNTLVASNADTGQQRFLYGHTSHLSAAAFSIDGIILATAQTGKEAIVRVWDFQEGKCVSILSEHSFGLRCLDISQDSRALVAVGCNAQGRQTIVVWDISCLLEGYDMRDTGIPQIPKVIVKHSTEYHIEKLKFSPFEEDHLMSCGRDSIRVYRFKHGQLRGCSVKIGESKIARTSPGVSASDMVKTVFTDLSFEMGYGITSLDRKYVFVSSVAGAVYQVNYGLRAVECIYQLHNGVIHSIDVNEGFCVTGSDDNFLRVWPTDFSDYFLEAEHDSPVTCTKLSNDGLQICVSTEIGSVGTMDIPTQQYRTLQRSHTDNINAIAVDPNKPEFCSVSCDGTIRIWSTETGEQLYEFKAPNEIPLCVAYHPLEYVIACGFEGGIVRIFDVATTTMVQENRQHDGSVEQVAFVPDGTLLFSAGAEGNVCIYNSRQSYLPTKYLATSVRAKRTMLAVSGDGAMLATVGVDMTHVLLFNVVSLSLIRDLSAGGSVVRQMEFSPDSKELILLTRDNELLRYSLQSGVLLQRMSDLHRIACETFSVNLGMDMVVTGGGDGIIKVWEYLASEDTSRKALQKPQSYIGHHDNVVDMQFSEKTKQFVSVAGDAILVWKVAADIVKYQSSHIAIEDDVHQDDSEPREPLQTLPSTYESAFAPRCQVGGHYSNVLAPSIATGHGVGAALSLRAVVGYDGRAINNVVWDGPNGRVAYTCMNIIIVQELASREQRHIQGLVTEISTLALSPDGSLLASGAAAIDGTATAPVHIWNVSTGRCIQILRLHVTTVQSLTFSPDGKMLLSVGSKGDNTVAVWELSSSALLAQVNAMGQIHAAAWRPGPAMNSKSAQFVTVGSPTESSCGVQLWTVQGTEINTSSWKVAKEDEAPLTGFTSLAFSGPSHLMVGDVKGGLWYCSLFGDREMRKVGAVSTGTEIDFLHISRSQLIAAGDVKYLHVMDIDLDRLADGISMMRVSKKKIAIDGAVRGLAFDGEGCEGVFGTDTGNLWYLSGTEADPVAVVTSQMDQIEALSTCGITPIVAAADCKGRIRIYERRNRFQIMDFGIDESHTGACSSISFSGTGGACIAGYANGLLRAFNIENASFIGSIERHHAAVISLMISPNGEFFVSGSADGAVCATSISTMTTLFTCLELVGRGRLLGMDFAGSERDMVCAALYPTSVEVYAVNWRRQRLVKCWEHHQLESEEDSSSMLYGSILKPTIKFLSKDKSTVIYTHASVDGAIHFLNYVTGQVYRQLKVSRPVCSLALGIDGGLAVGSVDGIVSVLKKKDLTWEDVGMHPGPVLALAYSDTDTELWSSTSSGALLVWRIRD